LLALRDTVWHGGAGRDGSESAHRDAACSRLCEAPSRASRWCPAISNRLARRHFSHRHCLPLRSGSA